jgi:hypothetical protein
MDAKRLVTTSFATNHAPLKVVHVPSSPNSRHRGHVMGLGWRDGTQSPRAHHVDATRAEANPAFTRGGGGAHPFTRRRRRRAADSARVVMRWR